jgi:type IV secretory pathway TrbF-like protein
MAWFSRKGRAPKAWNHRLANPYVEDKPATDGREGALLASVANWQRISLLLALGLGGMIVNNSRLTGRVQMQTRPYVVEVAQTGQVRTVGVLPQEPWQAPSDATIAFVLKFWLFHVRSVGDSQVILGQAWEEAMSFTDPKMQPWLREQIAERYERWKRKEAVQITVNSVLPIARQKHAYKVAWEEATYTVAGEMQRRKKWEATLTVRVRPPQNLEETKNWRNGLGILIDEVHWMEL